MKIGSITTKICKSDSVKKGLELVANNGAGFMAGTQLAFATVVRPMSIISTPKTDKENKKLACAKSFASSLTNYLMVLAVSLPIARNIKKIDNNPEKYLKTSTINKMKEGTKPLVQSKTYQFATQMFKLGSNALTAVPRAVVTCAMIPPMLALIKGQSGKLDKLGKEDKLGTNRENNQDFQIDENSVLGEEKNLIDRKLNEISDINNTSPSFKGGLKGLNIAKKMAKFIDTPFMQKFSERFKDTNFPMHTMAVTDTLTTATLCYEVNKNKKIDNDRKKVLNNNALISTGLGILSGYFVDKLTDKPTEKFIKKFSEINKHDKKLSKYIEGIKIAKPTILYAGVYYTVIPLVSTFLAERLGFANKNK